tara:strand:- start:739 stop:1497 length:759 start_codon:yes stop_codon:yes gene_type:complete
MFNMKKVSVMVASALYLGVGTSAAALNDQAWPEQPAGYAPKQTVTNEFVWEDKVNNTVKKQSRVFTPEKDISGIQTYIVQLDDAPISTYQGGVKGLASTKDVVMQTQQAATRSTLNMAQPAIATYANHLASKRQSVLSTAMSQQGLQLNVERTFNVTLNGFTTQMTQDEAKRLAKVAGVKKITRSKIYSLNTFNTIEQTGASALWSTSASNPSSNKGEGTVVGIIDTGINTDHPSFAAVGGDGYTHTRQVPR